MEQVEQVEEVEEGRAIFRPIAPSPHRPTARSPDRPIANVRPASTAKVERAKLVCQSFRATALRRSGCPVQYLDPLPVLISRYGIAARRLAAIA